MTEPSLPKEGSMFSNINPLAMAGVPAVGAICAVAYYTHSKTSALSEEITNNRNMLITTIKNVDQMIERNTDDPEKYNEIIKSIELNSRTLNSMELKVNQLTQQTERIVEILNSLQLYSEQIIGFNSKLIRIDNPPQQNDVSAVKPPQPSRRSATSLIDQL